MNPASGLCPVLLGEVHGGQGRSRRASRQEEVDRCQRGQARYGQVLAGPASRAPRRRLATLAARELGGALGGEQQRAGHARGAQAEHGDLQPPQEPRSHEPQRTRAGQRPADRACRSAWSPPAIPIERDVTRVNFSQNRPARDDCGPCGRGRQRPRRTRSTTSRRGSGCSTIWCTGCTAMCRLPERGRDLLEMTKGRAQPGDPFLPAMDTARPGTPTMSPGSARS
jgi:hypothetical protein